MEKIKELVITKNIKVNAKKKDEYSSIFFYSLTFLPFQIISIMD